MTLGSWIQRWWARKSEPEHLRLGRLGEDAARRHLQQGGMKFLCRNVRSRRGELDLVFRDGDCLVFVEVKARSRDAWARPAAAVTSVKKRRLTRAALDYLRRLPEPRVKVRFDVVEVWLEEGHVDEVRHLPGAFTMTPPCQFG